MTGLTIAGAPGFFAGGHAAGMLIAWLRARVRHAEEKTRYAGEKGALAAELQSARAAQ